MSEIEIMEREGLTLVDRVRAVAITSPESYQEAGQTVLGIKLFLRRVDDAFDPVVKAALQSHRQAIAQKKKYREPGEQALEILTPKITGWEREQARLRDEEERRLREEARKRAEEEALARAVEAEQAGEKELAEEIIHAPVAEPVVPSLPPAPKVKGLSTRTTWKARVVNAGFLPREYMIPDQQKLDLVTRSI